METENVPNGGIPTVVVTPPPNPATQQTPPQVTPDWLWARLQQTEAEVTRLRSTVYNREQTRKMTAGKIALYTGAAVVGVSAVSIISVKLWDKAFPGMPKPARSRPSPM